jgi:hypothetical protein
VRFRILRAANDLFYCLAVILRTKRIEFGRGHMSSAVPRRSSPVHEFTLPVLEAPEYRTVRYILICDTTSTIVLRQPFIETPIVGFHYNRTNIVPTCNLLVA